MPGSTKRLLFRLLTHRHCSPVSSENQFPGKKKKKHDGPLIVYMHVCTCGYKKGRFSTASVCVLHHPGVIDFRAYDHGRDEGFDESCTFTIKNQPICVFFFVCIVADGYTIRPTVYAVYATLWPVIHRGSAKKRHNTVENRSGKGESYRKPGVMHGPYRWSDVVFAPLSSCPLFWCVFPFRTLTAHGSFVIVAGSSFSLLIIDLAVLWGVFVFSATLCNGHCSFGTAAKLQSRCVYNSLAAQERKEEKSVKFCGRFHAQRNVRDPSVQVWI